MCLIPGHIFLKHLIRLVLHIPVAGCQNYITSTSTLNFHKEPCSRLFRTVFCFSDLNAECNLFSHDQLWGQRRTYMCLSGLPQSTSILVPLLIMMHLLLTVCPDTQLASIENKAFFPLCLETVTVYSPPHQCNSLFQEVGQCHG